MQKDKETSKTIQMAFAVIFNNNYIVVASLITHIASSLCKQGHQNSIAEAIKRRYHKNSTYRIGKMVRISAAPSYDRVKLILEWDYHSFRCAMNEPPYYYQIRM